MKMNQLPPVKRFRTYAFFAMSIFTVCLLGYAYSRKLLLEELIFSHKQLGEQASQYLKEKKNLENQDQYQINQALLNAIDKTEKTYSQAIATYEELVKLRDKTKDTRKLDELFTNAIVALSHQEYATGEAILTQLNQGIADTLAKLAASFLIPPNTPESNTPPGSGFSQQTVSVDGTSFLVHIVAGDLGSTRVIVDTASDHDCFNNCPTLALSDYVGRNGAFAGVNGSYFCPAEYPSCAGKTNTFDTLLMNKNKVYFNSGNNVYSAVPAVIFFGGSVRFAGQSLEWGRDTSPDSLIANRPLLVSGGNIVFTGEGEPKEGNKGNRSFVSNKGNIVYIGVVLHASVAESAKVLHALSMDNAINLDDGGSTALWSGGYKVGPGRNIPNAILFVRK